MPDRDNLCKIFEENEGLVLALSYYKDVLHRARARQVAGENVVLDSIFLPHLVLACNRHNIVQYRGHYYIVPHALGRLNLARPEDRRKPGIIRCGSMFEALETVVQLDTREDGRQEPSEIAEFRRDDIDLPTLSRQLELMERLVKPPPRRLFTGLAHEVIKSGGRFFVAPRGTNPLAVENHDGDPEHRIVAWGSYRKALIAAGLSDLRLSWVWRFARRLRQRYVQRGPNAPQGIPDRLQPRALARWLRSLAKRPDAIAELGACAHFLRIMGREWLAEDLIATARATLPKKPDAALRYAAFLDAAGLPDAAVSYLRDTLGGDCPDPHVQGFIGKTRHKQHLWRSRFERLYAQQRLQPLAVAGQPLDECCAYLVRDNLAEALEASERAARAAPEVAALQNIYGAALQSAGRWREAVAAHERAYAIRRSATTVRYLGDALLGAERADDAVEFYRSSIAFRQGEDAKNELLVCDFASVQELCQRQGYSYDELDAGERVELVYAAAAGGRVKSIRRTIETRPTVVAELRNVEKLDAFSTLLVGRRHLVVETFQEEPYVHAYRENFPLMPLIGGGKVLVSLPPRIARVTEPCVHPVIGGQFNFYSWMVEILPRIGLLEKHELHRDLKLVFSRPLTSWQWQTLALLGIPKERVVSLREFAPVAFDRAVVPITSLYEIPNLAAIRFVRERLLARGRTAGATRHARRLYISRSSLALHRRLVNEEQVEAHFRSRGFKVVSPERMSIADQINAFADAEIIAGPAGAWCSNIVFASPGARVVVFGPVDHQGQMFQLIGSVASVRYCAVIGRTVPSMLNDRSHWNYVVALLDVDAALDYCS